MKRCPECKRDYYDDSLMYCLDDGSELLEGPASGESSTVILPQTSNGEAATRPNIESEVQSETAGKTKVPPVRTRSKKTLLLVISVITLAAGSIGLALYKFARKSPAPFQSTKIAKLTNIGNVDTAQISPNGEYVAHVVYENGKNSVRVWDLATRSSIDIVPPTDDDIVVSVFSPDSRYIFFMRRAAGQVFILYQITVFGGPPKKILDNLDSGITFSPDGSRLAFVRRSLDGSSLIIAKSDGTEERTLAERKGDEQFGSRGPAWSPDGKVIATAISVGSNMTLAAISVEDGKLTPISSQKWPAVFRVAWLSDGSGLVFSAGELTLQNQVWYVSYPGGEARRITNDTNSYGTTSLGLTADSSTIATLQLGYVSNLFVAPVDDITRARQVTHNVNALPSSPLLSWTPDGKLLYSSTVGGNSDIWITNADGTGNRQLTNDPAYDGRALATADGRYIVFDSSRQGQHNIWRMNADGSNLKQLTNGEDDEAPRLSPDGWVIYDAIATSDLRKVRVDGGDVVRLTERRVFGPAVSPKDGMIAGLYQVDANSPSRLAIFSAEGGAPVRLFDAPSASQLVWTADGRAVLYIVTKGATSSLWSQSIDGGSPKQVADFSPDRVFSLAVSADGKQLAFARGNIVRDVVLITDTGKQ